MELFHQGEVVDSQGKQQSQNPNLVKRGSIYTLIAALLSSLVTQPLNKNFTTQY
jgi:hypothetical protein